MIGYQENIVYQEVEKGSKDSTPYDKVEFHTAILDNEKAEAQLTNVISWQSSRPKPKLVWRDQVGLIETSRTSDVPWHLEKDEIHRVVWRGDICALIYAHHPNGVQNKEHTTGYLVASDHMELPFAKNLYMPIKEDHCKFVLGKVKEALEMYQVRHKE